MIQLQNIWQRLIVQVIFKIIINEKNTLLIIIIITKGLRRVSKEHLRRIAKASGAKVITTLANEEGSESFEPEFLGTAQEVYEEAVGDNDFIFFKGLKSERAASIIVRGANEMMCDEIERYYIIMIIIFIINNII